MQKNAKKNEKMQKKTKKLYFFENINISWILLKI
mgnify:CR=1 FL=1